MGTCKQLLPLRGEPAVARAARTLLEGGATQVVVVVADQAVEAAVSHLPVTVVYARDAKGEMSDSAREGLRAVAPAASAVMIALADQPLLHTRTVEALIQCHRRQPSNIFIPNCHGRKGHPSLFPYNILQCFVQPLTLRDLLNQHAELIEMIEVDDEGAVRDMDTPEEYAALQEIAVTRFDV